MTLLQGLSQTLLSQEYILMDGWSVLEAKLLPRSGGPIKLTSRSENLQKTHKFLACTVWGELGL